ncbi:hypothetical protein PVAP13_6NG031666 [Panicum virgatum]|uniref:Endonuclease/exonuclease/phosphatase domain-containing protein n=1 Tax=Panicum virgatum TaxID=38727 RepID=A0A8T0QU76_PANVG|nr:hypothetical protein PVAP13_6NG031666 [Panicum virgatum]
MKGIYWNSRGLSDLTKYCYISEAIREQNLDFVAVMETGKKDVSRANLNRLSGGADYIWQCLPPRGRSGGILLGEFFIKFHLRNKSDDFKWILMAVYGPAQDDFKPAFLAELVRTCQQNPVPTLIGGDFNIMRHSKEKNKNNFNPRWPFLFNAVIDSFDLREIELTGHQFTWANSLSDPTFEKLDRVLMTTEWEFKYPLVTVHALDRGVSDHAPLLLDMGEPSYTGVVKQFKMELSWFSHEDFRDRVVQIWNKSVNGQNAAQRWNRKLGALRKDLRRWAAHIQGEYKTQKQHFQNTVTSLDTMIANGKHRKKRIFSLDHEGIKIEGQNNLKTYITQFYKDLFGPPEDNNFYTDEHRTGDIPQVSQPENDFLTAPFTEKEIRDAVFDMEHNKAPGPDGFPAEFYQHFWDIIKGDLMQVFHELHTGDLPVFSLNFGVATIHINSVADHLISPTQTTFLRGRNILEGSQSGQSAEGCGAAPI